MVKAICVCVARDGNGSQRLLCVQLLELQSQLYHIMAEQSEANYVTFSALGS